MPGKATAAELRAMALQQQQQIDAQHQLLAAKEQRLRFLRTQEIRGAAVAAEGERLRRLRERVQAQESKLRRLRALRGQADLQKSYNVTLSKYSFYCWFDLDVGCKSKYNTHFTHCDLWCKHGPQRVQRKHFKSYLTNGAESFCLSCITRDYGNKGFFV